MMKLFDRYVFKNLLVATVFTAAILAVVIMLTQSLRFLELVMEAGASSGVFWMLTFLALPRFLEIILPLALMGAVLFIYNRMMADSELIVIRAVGFGPSRLARPAVILSCIAACALWGVTMWVAPKSLAAMQMKRQEVKAQFSTLIFREGVFNRVGNGLTVYARKRADDGTLLGLMIHDSRPEQPNPVTVLANRGVLVAGEKGYEVLVYDGTRQEYNAEKQILNRLNFERYTIAFPDKDPIDERWQEPNERTIFELLNPDPSLVLDEDSLREFKIEIHRRVVSPLLAVAFTLIACALLLIGPVNRRGQVRRIISAVMIVVCIQGIYIASLSIARQSNIGFVMMYGLALLPILSCGFLLSGFGDYVRRGLFYKRKELPQGGA